MNIASRARINSDGAWLTQSTNCYDNEDGKRASSFNDNTGYRSSPYLLSIQSNISLDTLPFNSPVRERRKQNSGWFERFRSRKEKSSDRSWHTTSSDEHRDMHSQYPGEITREYPSYKSKYASSKRRYTDSVAIDSPTRSNVRTVQVEVHESLRSHTLDSVVLENNPASVIPKNRQLTKPLHLK